MHNLILTEIRNCESLFFMSSNILALKYWNEILETKDFKWRNDTAAQLCEAKNCTDEHRVYLGSIKQDPSKEGFEKLLNKSAIKPIRGYLPYFYDPVSKFNKKKTSSTTTPLPGFRLLFICDRKGFPKEWL